MVASGCTPNFRLIPGLKSASGIFRVYLKQAHPHLAVYVSPVNLDPARSRAAHLHARRATAGNWPSRWDLSTRRASPRTPPPTAPACSPGKSSSSRAKRCSPTACACSATSWTASRDGLLFYYFSSVDQNSHMLWGRYDADLLEIYKAVDGAIGDAMQKAGAGETGLLVISDHGFARFDRAVHLNTFLMRQGFLALDDPANGGRAELFAHVDWSRTMAYAIGLNGIYLNLEGPRERWHRYPPPIATWCWHDRRAPQEFTDPVSGEKVVDQVYFPETAFQGRNLKTAPDLLVGFRRGYRASWQTALGAVPPSEMEDNTRRLDRRPLHGRGRSSRRAAEQPQGPRGGARAGRYHRHHPG